MRWVRKGVLGLIGFIVVLGVIGALYQVIGSIIDQKRNPPPGKLVDVGGYALHLYCTGAGNPTVVLGSMSPGWSLYWSAVQPEVAKFTRVCSYDRAGYGWSDPGPTPRSAQQDATELHTLLTNAKIAAPYVLVGHSFSGFTMRLFRRQHPSEVAGIVLVDAGQEDVQSQPESKKATENFDRQLPFLRAASTLGVIRLVANFNTNSFVTDRQVQMLSPETRAELRAGWTRSSYVKTLIEEYQARQETGDRARASGSFGDLPLVVITATDPVKYPNMPVKADLSKLNDEWLEQQKKLVALSSRSTQILADKSSHFVQFDQPQVVVDGIRRALEMVRTP